ncbi:lysozyme [Paracoccus siganidrum]|uniref:Lysozyme n=1 Tax=Paracoccus siganidrum TaxID=1276757 RepID=A0A419ACA5_9RHOB|nr:lysozyme [Paracoccus siganidrum]RJL22148.1 lysozyme [Paracoccus siganidrum]RMC30408.1 lysozyme [Paracoccus siganidrum]
MQMTDRGLLALVRHEGIVPGPYLDVKQVWTFGIGHTAAAGAPDPATMPRGMPADLDAGIREASRVFRSDLARYEAEVLRAVKVPLQPHEFDALVSFHYNTGGIAKAALTRHLNAGDRAAAAAAFMGWLKPAAIRPRREAERDLFATGRYPTGTIPVWSVDRDGRVDFSRPIRRLTEDEALALLRPTSAPVPTQTIVAPSWWRRLLDHFKGKATS